MYVCIPPLFFLRTTNRPVLTLLPLSRSVLPPLISLAIQFFSYMYICMDPPHSNPTCAQTFHTAAAVRQWPVQTVGQRRLARA